MKRLTCIVLVLLLSCGPTRRDEGILIRAGTLIDGTGAPARHRCAVLVRGGVIERVGEYSMEAPGATVIEAPEGTLLPGLVDLHVHLGGGGGAHITAAENDPEWAKTSLRGSLAAGVTSVRSLGDDPDVSFSLRGSVPRVFAVGPSFTGVGGHPVESFGFDEGLRRRAVREVADVAQIAPWMDELAALKADAVKAIYDGGVEVTGREIPKLSKEALAETIRQAHRHHLRCVVHVGGKQDALDALDLGADGIEHVPAGMDGDVIAKLKEKDAFWVPTFGVIWQYSVPRAEIEAYLARPELRAVVPRILHFSATHAAVHPGADKVAEHCRPILDAGLRHLAAAYRSGVRIGTGSDAGNPNIFHGAGLLLELEMLVRGGLTPVEAIHCATGRAGEHLGRPGFGTIAPGRPADLLVLRGDASKDLRALYEITAILVDGRPIERNDFLREYDLPERVETPAIGAHYGIYTDRFSGGKSDATAERGEAWRFSGEIRAGGYYPFAALSLELTETGFQVFDARGCAGLRFKIRGKASSLTLGVGSMSVQDYDVHSTAVETGDEWRSVEIPFDKLKQRGFGKKADFDASRLRTLQFMVAAPGAFELWIRDLEFYR